MEAWGFILLVEWVGGLAGRGRVSTGRRVREARRGLLWRGLLRRVVSWNLIVGRADGVDGCAFYSWSSRPLGGRPCA